MKTQLAVFFGTLVIAGLSLAGPSDSAAFAVRHAQQQAGNVPSGTAPGNVDPGVTVAPASHGKGVVQVPTRDEAATNIALYKSGRR